MSRSAKIFVLITIALFISVSELFAQVNMMVGTLDLGNPAHSTVNLNNSSAIITNDSFSKIYDYVVSGYDHGAWDGYGIISSYAKTHPPYTLGILTGADYKEYNSDDFFGYTVQDSWILIRYTPFGDSNLDGVVDDLDHELVTDAYQRLHDSNPNNNPPINWLNGDYNYDGVINQLDSSLVPEPSSLILLGTGGLMLLGLWFKRYFRVG